MSLSPGCQSSSLYRRTGGASLPSNETANATPERWAFRLRFHTCEDVSLFQRACREEGLSLDITSVHDLRKSDIGADAGPGSPELTGAQREVVVAAIESGYFAVPRRTTLVEIADTLGISDQSVSERPRQVLLKLSMPAVTPDPERAE